VISLFTRFVIIISIIVSVTDTIMFYIIWKHGMQTLTLEFEIAWIIVTIIPIVVNLWFWLIFKKQG
jgi:hypothetical protein